MINYLLELLKGGTVQIQELEKKIVEASLRYYKGQTLIMTDEQFDTAIEELRKLDPNHWILKTPGWGASDSEGKINHIGSNPVGSLDKIKFPGSSPIFSSKGILTPKLDGLTVVTNVYNGKITALTRNNGIVGKDCTNKIIYLLQNKHPKFYQSLLNTKGMFSFRGEVVTDPSCHDHLKTTVGISLRNIAAGLINRIDVSPDLHNLLYVPYFIRVDSENNYLNNKEMIDKLEDMGAFPIPHEEFTSVDSQYLQSIYEDWKIGFLIDGIVVSSYQDWEEGPDYTINESHALAYKFESEEKDGIVERISWSTGTAGRVNPVVVLTSPIELSGAMVQNISAHHAKNIIDNKIGPGAIIKVTRANEVIPYINSVVSPSSPWVDSIVPSTCPSCNSPTILDGCYLMCLSTDCPAQSRTLIFRLFEFCNQPEGLSVTTITKWLDEFPVNGGFSNIESIVDFIALFKQVPLKNTAARAIALQSKFNNHYGALLNKFEINIQSKLENGLTPAEFWYILNLKGLGSESAKKLSHVNPRTLELQDIDKTLSSVSGITYLVGDSLKSLYSKWKSLSKMIRIVEPVIEEKSSNKYSNVVFCLTGVRDKELSRTLLDNGATELGGVGKGCNLLIAKDPSSSSSKAQQAREKGIEIISLEEARKRFL